ncbi:hypothetical protein [Ornithinimicrobium kibberense]|uniref:hypothetical protein n=1 Tax=Ornithinimicrobium kibberense TaxID=282060 RepID=UPI00362170FE
MGRETVCPHAGGCAVRRTFPSAPPRRPQHHHGTGGSSTSRFASRPSSSRRLPRQCDARARRAGDDRGRQAPHP